MSFDPRNAGNYKPPTIQSKVPTTEYKEGYDRIFNKTLVAVFCRRCRELELKCTCDNFEPDQNTK